MKYINRKWLFIVLLLTSASFLLNACSDDGDATYEVKLFVNNGVYPINTYMSGIQYNRIKDIVQTKNGKIEFPIASTLPVMKDVRVEFGISESLLDTYNTNHETDYKLFPKESFKLVNNIAIIQQDKALSTDSIKIEIINTENVAIGNYLLPLSITAISDKNLLISSNMANVYVMVSVTELCVEIVDTPIGKQITDKSKWSYILNGKPTDLYTYVPDGSILEVNMGEQVDLKTIGMEFYESYFSSAGVDLAISKDGQNYENIGSVSFAYQRKHNIHLVTKKAQYLKMVLKGAQEYTPYITDIYIYTAD